MQRKQSHENLQIMRLIDEEHLRNPARGSRQMIDHLEDLGMNVNRKRVQRLMRKMGIEGVSPKRRTTLVAAGHRLSVPASRTCHGASQPGLVQRHHVRSDARRVHVLGGRDGLV